MTEQTAKQRASQMILIVPLGSPPDTRDGEPVSELWLLLGLCFRAAQQALWARNPKAQPADERS
jgi:hypothetical protein